MEANHRVSAYNIDPLFLERWSPRAFTNEGLPKETLMTILEAGHWAASSSNAQPWRFIYVLRESAQWKEHVDLLAPGNQEWAQHAAALIFVASATTSKSPHSEEEKPSPTHSFDTGAASAYMVLQALKLGWHAHGMAGFDRDRSKVTLKVPEKFAMEAVFAIGKCGPKASLSEELQKRETPSPRKPLGDVVFEETM